MKDDGISGITVITLPLPLTLQIVKYQQPNHVEGL